MSIGYYNFGNIQQGNQQVVNSMVSLGQQLAQAVNTHAAVQSAQTMLPMLQQQYQQGMQKIAKGDPNGIGDIYGAALVASQNPLLAPMAKSAITLANNANIQTQHTLRSQAAQQGMMDRYNMRYGQGGMSAYQQEQVAKNTTTAKNNQINEYGALYSGDPSKNIDGIGSYASRINEAISNGNAPDAKDIQGLASMYSIYKQKQAAYGQNAVTNPQIENAFKQIQGKIPALTNLVKKEQGKGGGFLGIQALGGTNPSKVEALSQGIEQLQGLQSAGGNASSNSDQDALFISAKKAIQNGADPKAVQERLNQLIQQMRTPAQQSAPAMPTNQPTTMIPAASGMGGMAQAEPEEPEPVEEPEEPTFEV